MAGLAGCGGDGSDTTTAGGNGNGNGNGNGGTTTGGNGNGMGTGTTEGPGMGTGTGTSTGTSTGTATPEPPDFPSEMTFLHFETDEARRSAIGEIGSAWQEETGTSLNQRAVAEASLPTEIQASIAADDIPATAELPANTLLDTRGLIDTQNANEIISEFGEDAFFDKALEFVSDGEDYLGVPLYMWTQLYGWDENYRTENDLPVPNTWEDFRTFAEFTHDPDNNKFGCLVGTDNTPYTLQSFQPFALSNDAHVFDEEGNIIFDNQEMVEALEYYGILGNLTPPGETGADDFGAWEKRQTYVYTSNTISFFFETAFDEGPGGWKAALSIDGPKKEATYGECVSTATMLTQNASKNRASKSFQKFMHRTEEDLSTPTATGTATPPPAGSNSPYVNFCHLQPGLFNPTRPAVLDSDAYRSLDLFDKWPDAWLDEDIPNSIANAERFGRRGSNVFPEIGDIRGELLITDAIKRVINGDAAGTVASETAEEMRNVIS